MRKARDFVRLLVKAIRTKAGDDPMTKRVDEKLLELERETTKTREVVELNTERIKRVEDLVLAGGDDA